MIKEADSALQNWSDWESCTTLALLLLCWPRRGDFALYRLKTHETKSAHGSLQCKTPIRTCVKEPKNHLKTLKILFVKYVDTFEPVVHKAWSKSKQIHSLIALLKGTLLQCYLCKWSNLIPHNTLRQQGLRLLGKDKLSQPMHNLQVLLS